MEADEVEAEDVNGVRPEDALAALQSQRRRAADALVAVEEISGAIAAFGGVKLIVAASGAERRLLQVARNGGLNAAEVREEADKMFKKLKLRWLAAQQPVQLARAEPRQGEPTMAQVGSLAVNGWAATLRTAEIRLVRDLEVLFPGFSDRVPSLRDLLFVEWLGAGDESDMQQWVTHVLSSARWLTVEVDLVVLKVLRELWEPHNGAMVELEHLSRLPTSPRPGGRLQTGLWSRAI